MEVEVANYLRLGTCKDDLYKQLAQSEDPEELLMHFSALPANVGRILSILPQIEKNGYAVLPSKIRHEIFFRNHHLPPIMVAIADVEALSSFPKELEDPQEYLIPANFPIALYPIEYASACGSVKCVEFLLMKKCKTRNALMWAVAIGNDEIIKLLREKKASTDGCKTAAKLFYQDDIANEVLKKWKLSDKPTTSDIDLTFAFGSEFQREEMENKVDAFEGPNRTAKILFVSMTLLTLLGALIYRCLTS